MFNHGRLLIGALAMSVGMAAPAVHADDLRNAGERLQDRQEIRQDRRGIADDRADLDRLSDLITRWNEARAQNDQAAQSRMEKRIAAELRSDLKETAAQAGKDQREVRRDRRELRSDRREVREDRREVHKEQVQGDAPGARAARRELRDDRRDRRGDRRDMRDDKADAARAAEVLGQKRAVAVQLRELQREIDGGIDEATYRDRQSALLEQYLSLSQQELEMGLRELREDRGELREDRRETREDRRQR